MIRALTLLALLAITAEVSAQTTPATKAATRRATTQGPHKAPTKRMSAASAAPTRPASSGNGAVGSTEGANIKGQNAYAAPGMPINVDNPKKVEGYNGPAPTKPRSRTTLAPR